MSEFIRINSRVYIPVQEVSFDAIRAQGSGGQNVNKVATAVPLRYAVTASSLPQAYKSRLLGARDRRISAAGVLVIKAQRFRSQEKNKQEALERLSTVIRPHTGWRGNEFAVSSSLCVLAAVSPRTGTKRGLDGFVIWTILISG